MKRLISILIVSCMLVSMLPISALAQTYDLSDGSITISTKESGGQYVAVEGGSEELQTSTTVIKSTGTTDNTITVSTKGDTTADFTLEDVSIDASGGKSAIEIGGSSANITLQGDNELSAEDASGIHVSSGELTISGDGSLSVEATGDHAVIGSSAGEDMSGSIHITGDTEVAATTNDPEDYFEGAAIGSGEDGDLSGSITIDGNAKVSAFSGDEGAGIGTGYRGDLTEEGSITIGGNAEVTARSNYDGAGIGAGEDGNLSGSITISGNTKVTAVSDADGAGVGTGEDGCLSGSITISGNAKVTAWSDDEGAGIGTGEDGTLSGSITINGNAEVIAGSDDNGAGIGCGGDDGHFTEKGSIIIGGHAKVTAIGEEEGCGIGAGEDALMKGTIVIREDAEVLAIAGDCAAAIGSDDEDEMTGTIAILGNAKVTTGVRDRADFDYDTKTITYALTGETGYIGDSDDSRHSSGYGTYLIGPDVTINGVRGSQLEDLKQYVNMRLDEDGNMENLALLQTSQTDGAFSAEILNGVGEVVAILYNGQAEVPTAPGSYKVTCTVRMNGEEITLPIGVLEIPEPIAGAVNAPLYRVTDEAGRDIAYTAQQNGTVLTVTAHAETAVLTGSLSAMTALRQQGVETVRFVTNSAVSAFRTDDLLAHGGGNQIFALFHRSKTAEMTLNGVKLTGILFAE